VRVLTQLGEQGDNPLCDLLRWEYFPAGGWCVANGLP